MEIQRCPLVMTNSLLLKMTIEIVDLPIDSMVIFHRFLLTFTRGYRTIEIVDLPIDSMVIFHRFLLTFTRGYRTIEIVDLPIDSMVIFHSFLLTFTRGYRAVLYDVNIMTTSKGVVLAK